MNRRYFTFPALLLTLAALSVGCRPTAPFYFFDDGDLSHYKQAATEIEYPDVDVPLLSEVAASNAPLTLAHQQYREVWALPLEEAVRHALENSKIMRSIGGQVFAPPAQLTGNPNGAQSAFSPGIVESDARFGTEAALAAFDAQFTSSVFWEKNDRAVNNSFGGLLARTLEQDRSTFQAEIAKTAATGTRFAFRNNTTYDWNNNPVGNLFPSAWDTNFEAEFRHPLLQGSGATFNRIAGPNGTPGFSNGVSIARINVDIALADFEAGVRNVTSDVEVAYWELYFAYRNLDAVIAGRDAALGTWRKIHALYDVGAQGGEAEKEAQAAEQYFLFRGQVEDALSNLYSVENRLRYMMGLGPSDGRLIRPADEPPTSDVRFDWFEVQTEALVRSVELRRQKWQIKQRELELVAQKNYLLPRLDAVGIYRWRGLGDHLAGSSGNNLTDATSTGVTVPFDTAFGTLSDGDFQEWQMGLQLTVPIGFRQQLAAVRNAEMQLARDRALLQEQELEISHQLSQALRDVDRYYQLSVTNYNRRVTAARQVEAVQSAYEVNAVTLDLLLDAQRRLADAESSYYRSLVDYVLAIKDVHLRKGSLLEYNGVNLAEGPWTDKAYFDARKRARERDAGMFYNYGESRPGVFSRGPFPQRSAEASTDYEILGGVDERHAPMSSTMHTAPGHGPPAHRGPMIMDFPSQAAHTNDSHVRLANQPTIESAGAAARRPGRER